MLCWGWALSLGTSVNNSENMSRTVSIVTKAPISRFFPFGAKDPNSLPASLSVLAGRKKSVS